MLITNFAAGELSETLFGRTDLPQYRQGASLLKNFDVIPTGGIKRRGGSRHVAPLPGEGRLIPFLVDRDNHLLIFLSPGALRIYKNGALVHTETSVQDKPLYDTIEKIREVQCAQTNNLMVLTHRSRQPLMIGLNPSSTTPSFSLYWLEPNIEVETIEEGPTSAEAPYEPDNAYNANGWLLSERNYPACVAFFQGRLVFAATTNARQRLFFSKAGDISRFATYKRFLKENRQYIVAGAEIANNSKVATLISLEESLKFSQPLDAYALESPYFDPEAKIESLVGRTLTLTKEANIPEPLDEEKIALLNDWKHDADEQENNPLTLIIGQTTGPGITPYPNPVVQASLQTSRITMRAVQNNETAFTKIAIFDEGNIFMDATQAQNFLMQLGTELLQNYGSQFQMNVETGEQAENFSQMQTALLQNASYYTYTVEDKTYTGPPDVIYEEIINYYLGPTVAHLAFYTKELLADRHPTPEDGFTFEIASDMGDAIQWVAQSKSLLVGTETGEWVVPAGATAVNVQAALNSRHGSADIQGTSIGDALCFFQAGKKGLVEYYIPQQDNNFRANNMAMLSQNMLRESPARDFDFVSAPYTRIVVCREDGSLATLLYERGAGTFAWSRIATSGAIASVATLPGASGYDDVWLAVNRGGAWLLELLEEEAGVYLDCFKAWAGDASGYGPSAVVYDETRNIVYSPAAAPAPDASWRGWIGYPYSSVMRSMPVLANDQMKAQIIKALSMRFDRSFMPLVKAGTDGPPEHIPRPEPFSGVYQIPFPGSHERDAFFELAIDRPVPCRVLAINAEAQ
jgi:hypothetical protein